MHCFNLFCQCHRLIVTRVRLEYRSLFCCQRTDTILLLGQLDKSTEVAKGHDRARNWVFGLFMRAFNKGIVNDEGKHCYGALTSLLSWRCIGMRLNLVLIESIGCLFSSLNKKYLSTNYLQRIKFLMPML